MAEAASHICREVLPKFHRRRFARFADLVWDRSPACHHLYTQYLDAASRLRMPCKIHADQPGAAEAVAAAVHHLATSVDHLEGASRSDAALLAGTATMATLLPMASFRKSVVPPTRALIEAGVALAIASNFNPQHTPTLNMQTVIGFACIHLGMTPEQAITAATINGAHAIRRADKVGSLEVGKSADLLMLNLSDYRELGQHSGTNAVHMTMKGGECIYKEGEVMPRPAEEITSGLLTD
jgi:imidazolonepropionase